MKFPGFQNRKEWSPSSLYVEAEVLITNLPSTETLLCIPQGYLSPLALTESLKAWDLSP